MNNLPKSALVIDANVHLRSAAERHPAVTWPDDWPAGQLLNVADYQNAMKLAGIDRAVLVTGVRVDGFDNGPTLSAAAAAPGTFVPVANLDITADGASEALNALSSKGIAGIRFYGGAEPFADVWIGGTLAKASLESAAQMGLSVSFETINAACLPYLASLAERMPDTTIVVNAAASLTGAETDLAGMLAPLSPCKNVVLVMIPQQLESAALVRALAKVVGPQRLMWGSYSMYGGARLPNASPSLANVVTRVSEVFDFLDLSERDAILGENARRVYRGFSNRS